MLSMESVVGVFWDGENVRIPRGLDTGQVCNQIRKKVLPFGSIVEKLYYFDSRAANESKTDRTNLDLAGFKLVDCPKRGHKETIDKKIIVDLILFAVKHRQMGSSCTVVLVSGDGDYSYMLSRLRDLDVQVVVIFPETRTLPSQLFNASDIKLNWKGDILAEICGKAFDLEAYADSAIAMKSGTEKRSPHREVSSAGFLDSSSGSLDTCVSKSHQGSLDDKYQASELAPENSMDEFHIVGATENVIFQHLANHRRRKVLETIVESSCQPSSSCAATARLVDYQVDSCSEDGEEAQLGDIDGVSSQLTDGHADVLFMAVYNAQQLKSESCFVPVNEAWVLDSKFSSQWYREHDSDKIRYKAQRDSALIAGFMERNPNTIHLEFRLTARGMTRVIPDPPAAVLEATFDGDSLAHMLASMADHNGGSLKATQVIQLFPDDATRSKYKALIRGLGGLKAFCMSHPLLQFKLLPDGHIIERSTFE